MPSRSLAAALLGLASLLVMTTTSGASPAPTAAQGCVPKDNIEAIIDDSGSMALTDGDRLRVRAMELLIDNPENDKRTLGALEFGTDAQPLFNPEPIHPNRASMKGAIDAAVKADNGLTDYNDAFSLAGSQDPNATARIFLTDGGHNNEDSSPYNNGHAGGPPVYVIGLGVFGDSDQVLRRIADETGGRYLPVDDAGDLQSAMFDLNAAIGCLSKPITRKDMFTKQSQVQQDSVKLPAGTNSANLALSWDDASDRFDIVGIRVVRKGKTVARASKVRKLIVTKRRGATNVTVKIRRLVRGRLVFKLKAVRLSGGGSAELTTQIVRSRKR